MKNAVKILALVCVLAGSPAAFANTIDPENPKFAVGMYQDAKNLILNLMIDNVGSQNLTVKVYNEKNVLVYTEQLSRKQAKFRIKFNMAEMEDGKYRFVIADKTQEITKTVNLSSQQSRVIEVGK